MVNIQLNIDGQEVDLRADQTITNTFQINEFFKIAERKASFTNRFTLPATAKNMEIFGRLGIIGSTTRFPYAPRRADLSIDGIPVVIQGTCNVESFSETDGYSISIYSGVNSLFEKLGDDKLSDLNLTDLDHVLNPTSFTDSLTNTEGYIYALMDNGKHASGGPLIIDHLIPSVFAKTLWDKIFTRAGFTYEGDIFTDDAFLDLVVTPNNAYLPAEAGTAETLFNGEAEGTFFFRANRQELTLNGEDPNQLLSSQGTRLIIPETGNVELVLDIAVQISDPDLVGFYVLQLTVNNQAVRSIAIDSDNYVGTTTINTFLNVGDSVGLRFEPDFIVESPGQGQVAFISHQIEIAVDLIDASTPINFNQLFLDSITQKQFVKEIVQRFGLLIQRQKDSDVYEFIEIKKMLRDRSNAVDYGNKFAGRIDQNYSANGVARKNGFKYKYGQDEAAFADGSVLVDNTTLSKEADLIVSETRASRLTSKVISTSAVRLYSTSHFVPQDGGFKKEAPGIYLFNLLYINTTIQYRPESAGSNLDLTGVLPFANFKNSEWPTLIRNYYSEYAAVINTPKKEKIELNLTALDVYNFNFFRLIYISELGHYYFADKINNFVSGRLTTLEIVQIPELLRDAPTIQDVSKTTSDEFVLILSAANFSTDAQYISPDGSTVPETVKIETLPTVGELQLNAVPVTAGQEIPYASIDPIVLSYEIDGVAVRPYTDSFKFSVQNSTNNLFSNIATFRITVEEP